MPKTKSPPKFELGDAVRVRPGIADPEFDDIPIGGWAGEIIEVENNPPTIYLIRWNQQTLGHLHPVYRNRCERDGLDFEEMWLEEEDLEPDTGEPLEIEQPTNIVTKPLSMDDQDDRIRAVFGLTNDDLLPEADHESLVAYYKYLVTNLSFPFEAKYSFEIGPFQSKTFSITILGLLDPDDFPGDEYGLFCQALRDGERIELPLTEVEVGKRNPNRRLVADYSYWFVNW